MGHDLVCWTAQQSDTYFRDLKHYEIKRPWRKSAFHSTAEEMLQEKPDVLLVQYTPYLVAPSRGICLSLTSALRHLRQILRIPLVVMMHEIHYPIQPTKAGLALGIPQAIQANQLILASDLVIFSYERPMSKYQKRYFWRKWRAAWIPVGSTVAGYLSQQQNSLHKPQNTPIQLNPEDKILLYFGGAHPTHLIGHTLAVIQALKASGSNHSYALVMVGLDQSRIDSEVAKLNTKEGSPKVFGLGYLGFDGIKHWIERASWVLAPFMDGISTRRSSAMASLQLGKPVITTKGWSTDPSIPWSDFTLLVEQNNVERYVKESQRLISDEKKSETLGRKAKLYYDEHFSWEVIARQFIRKFEELIGRP